MATGKLANGKSKANPKKANDSGTAKKGSISATSKGSKGGTAKDVKGATAKDDKGATPQAAEQPQETVAPVKAKKLIFQIFGICDEPSFVRALALLNAFKAHDFEEPREIILEVNSSSEADFQQWMDSTAAFRKSMGARAMAHEGAPFIILNRAYLGNVMALEYYLKKKYNLDEALLLGGESASGTAKNSARGAPDGANEMLAPVSVRGEKSAPLSAKGSAPPSAKRATPDAKPEEASAANGKPRDAYARTGTDKDAGKGKGGGEGGAKGKAGKGKEAIKGKEAGKGKGKDVSKGTNGAAANAKGAPAGKGAKGGKAPAKGKKDPKVKEGKQGKRADTAQEGKQADKEKAAAKDPAPPVPQSEPVPPDIVVAKAGAVPPAAGEGEGDTGEDGYGDDYEDSLDPPGSFSTDQQGAHVEAAIAFTKANLGEYDLGANLPPPAAFTELERVGSGWASSGNNTAGGFGGLLDAELPAEAQEPNDREYKLSQIQILKDRLAQAKRRAPPKKATKKNARK